eukprot:CAMPEP_0116877998 /NCGR_PEP_ID=MMETSP0463-20121206/9753_1 /TAXON_ID=181622 /ORGANISM="Strombidinopsis sp, Strain SopsisLIS2011" /LENGTH=73 /DNA_ID=CAMNT_0004525789 /DNA_START=1780 /DNA_END=2001 /DNA_ORIENTATION=+
MRKEWLCYLEQVDDALMSLLPLQWNPTCHCFGYCGLANMRQAHKEIRKTSDFSHQLHYLEDLLVVELKVISAR